MRLRSWYRTCSFPVDNSHRPLSEQTAITSDTRSGRLKSIGQTLASERPAILSLLNGSSREPITNSERSYRLLLVLFWQSLVIFFLKALPSRPLHYKYIFDDLAVHVRIGIACVETFRWVKLVPNCLLIQTLATLLLEISKSFSWHEACPFVIERGWFLRLASYPARCGTRSAGSVFSLEPGCSFNCFWVSRLTDSTASCNDSLGQKRGRKQLSRTKKYPSRSARFLEGSRHKVF